MNILPFNAINYWLPLYYFYRTFKTCCRKNFPLASVQYTAVKYLPCSALVMAGVGQSLPCWLSSSTGTPAGTVCTVQVQSVLYMDRACHAGCRLPLELLQVQYVLSRYTVYCTGREPALLTGTPAEQYIYSTIQCALQVHTVFTVLDKVQCVLYRDRCMCSLLI